MNKKGFTLMEILFVLLIIALIVSFAIPVIRSVRYDIRNSQAKNALKKLLEARRSFYLNSKGVDITSGASFYAPDTKTYSTAVTCINPAASGIPSTATSTADPAQLFVCNFVNWKDFVSLPYDFHFCAQHSPTHQVCQVTGNDGKTMALFAMLHEGEQRLGGQKYYALPDGNTRYYMAVGWDGQIYENLE